MISPYLHKCFLTGLLVTACIFCQGASLHPLEDNEDYQAERELIRKAGDYEQEQEFKDAASCYHELGKCQNSPEKQALYYLQEADMLMQAKCTRKAYKVYIKLLKTYLFHVPVEEIIAKLRLLADAFETGEGLLWGISDPLEAIEVYRNIVQFQASSLSSIPDRLVLAEKLVRECEYAEAVQVLQDAVKLAPRNADIRLALAKTLYDLALSSDGDGLRTRAAIREIRSFLEYSAKDDPRRAECDEIIKKCRTLEAERIYSMALFYLNKYHRRPAVARRYLHDILRDYSDTETAVKARQTLELELPEESPAEKTEAAEPPSAPADGENESTL